MAGRGRLVLLLLWIAGMGGVVSLLPSDEPAQAATTGVGIVEFQFQTNPATIGLGDTVTWTNNGTTTHTSNSSTGVWASGNLAPGQSFSFTFNTAGTFTYFCMIHPFMQASVIVSDSPSATATPTATLTPTITPTPVPTVGPDVRVGAVRVQANLLRVTITARSGQTIQRLDWTLPANAAAEALDGTALPTGLTLPAGATSAVFNLRRVSGQAVHLPIVVTGSFGTWRTFVGGGPAAF